MGNNFVRPLALAVSLACLAFSGPSAAKQNQTNPDLTAHEWGTFTSVAARDGHALKWSALRTNEDLPTFIEHIHGAQFKAGLSGTLRMETPVIYFYSPAKTSVSVHVSFARGMITEWYPHASTVEPDPLKFVDSNSLFKHNSTGSISWGDVTVAPGAKADFPSEEGGNRYYAARQTSAAPLQVKATGGSQQEKFLFYRGVSAAKFPVSGSMLPDGKILIRNLGKEAIPQAILFERRGDSMGYRVLGAVRDEVSAEPPSLTATVDALNHDLESILVAQGLFADEAHAMVKTWNGSWSEEGSRLFYIVPKGFLGDMLPLTVDPVPGQMVRVFVGRMELITPVTERAVETALTTHNRQLIDKYGRFLDPIMEELKAENPRKAKELEKELSSTYSAQVVEPQPIR